MWYVGSTYDSCIKHNIWLFSSRVICGERMLRSSPPLYIVRTYSTQHRNPHTIQSVGFHLAITACYYYVSTDQNRERIKIKRPPSGGVPGEFTPNAPYFVLARIVVWVKVAIEAHSNRQAKTTVNDLEFSQHCLSFLTVRSPNYFAPGSLYIISRYHSLCVCLRSFSTDSTTIWTIENRFRSV